MGISNSTIEEVKSRMDIVEVIGDFVQLKKAGQNYKALSPFTDEKTPSFFVSPSKEIFKCFSTGKGGDAITFVMEYDGLSYPEAIRFLAEKYGIEIQEDEVSDEAMLAQNERESLFIALKQAGEYFADTLLNTEEGKTIGLSYFKERGFNEQIIQKFGLGYSLESWDGFYKLAEKKGFQDDVLEKAGLLVIKENKKYDRFRGRVMFPIQNLTGKIIGFGARTLKKDKKVPKYVNSPESEIYHKSDILYGIHQAKKAIRDADNCYLVEGYTDVISLHLSGIEHVVASSGTSLTEGQIKLIKRYTENVTVLFDGDAAGVKASIRGIDMLLEQGLNVRVVLFPEGEDPDSYAQKSGTAAFNEYLKNESVDFISFKANLYAKESENDPIKKAATIKDIVESISKVPDPVARSIYLKNSAELLKMDETVLIAEMNKILLGKWNDKKQYQKPVAAAEQVVELEQKKADLGLTLEDQLILQEKENIRLLVNFGYHEIKEGYFIHHYITDELEGVHFTNTIYNEILDLCKRRFSEGHTIDEAFLIENGSESIKKEMLNLIAETWEVSTAWTEKYEIVIPKEEDLLDTAAFRSIQNQKLKFLRIEISKNQYKLKEEMDPDQQFELLRMHQHLKQSEMEISKTLGIIIND